MDDRETETETSGDEALAGSRKSRRRILSRGIAEAHLADDFVLDVDLDEAPESSTYQPSAYVRRPSYKSPPKDWKNSVSTANTVVAISDPLARTQEFPSSVSEVGHESRGSLDSGPLTTGASLTSTQKLSTENLSPEVIDAIARRAVEHLSDKVVREIAWEVVPDLAELLIKRQLEENKS